MKFMLAVLAVGLVGCTFVYVKGNTNIIDTESALKDVETVYKPDLWENRK